MGLVSPAPSTVLGTWQELSFPEWKGQTQAGLPYSPHLPSPDQPKMLPAGGWSPWLPCGNR